MLFLKNKKIYPFLLTIFIVVMDQVTKALIVANIPLHVLDSKFFGDLLWITHERNLGIAFSIGVGLPGQLRSILFIILPIVVLAGVIYFYFKENFTYFQRWCLSGIIGGGIGNLIDRIFRSKGVVDFISIKFFGILGFDRWPTFNVADMSVVITGLLLIISMLIYSFKEKSNSENNKEA